MSEAGSYEISTWDGSETNIPPAEEKKPMLRRPYGPGEQRKPPPVGLRPVDEHKPPFKLSPNAPVFTPKTKAVHNQLPMTVQDRSLVHVPSMVPLESPSPVPTAAPAPSVVPVPSEHCKAAYFQDYPAPQTTPVDTRNADVLSDVRDILQVMAVNPGCFDDYIHQLVHALNTNPLDKTQLDNLTDFIYEQAIFDTNFTYTAAKVCNCLCINLVVEQGVDPFRMNLFNKLKKEYDDRDTALQDPTFTERLYLLTMFIAELFLNMEVMADNKPTKAKILRNALHGLMESLLKFQNNDNTRMLIKLLKLTGAQIEDFDREPGNKSKTINLQIIFSIIRDVVLDNKLQRNTRVMLLDLIELRASNWGRDTSSPTAQKIYSNSASGDSAVGVSDPNVYTYYSPDGRVISEEESSRFYPNENDFNNMDEYLSKWSLGNNGKSQNFNEEDVYYGSDTSYQDQSDGPDFFDDEVAAAFDEYLRLKDNR